LSTRVVLLGMPTMLRELVHGLIAVPADFGIDVEELPDATLSSPALRDRDIDLVILDTDSTSDHAVAAFLADHCRVKVLGVSADGRRGLLHEMRPQRVLVGELSREVLVDVVARSRPVSSSPGRDC
jgi:hypothetical protein